MHAGEVNGVAGDPRRSAGLEPVHGERQGAQAGSEGVRGRITGTAAGVALEADMDASTKKRSCRQHDRGRGEREAHRREDALDTALSDIDVDDRLLEYGEILLRLQHPANRVAVEGAVRLGAGRPHRRPLARIERTELDSGSVRRQRHRAAHRIDLSHQVALADAAYRGIAGHLPKGLDALGQ